MWYARPLILRTRSERQQGEPSGGSKGPRRVWRPVSEPSASATAGGSSVASQPLDARAKASRQSSDSGARSMSWAACCAAAFPVHPNWSWVMWSRGAEATLPASLRCLNPARPRDLRAGMLRRSSAMLPALTSSVSRQVLSGGTGQQGHASQVAMHPQAL